MSSGAEAAEAVLINGAPGGHVNWSDRGLQYGDGLFETIGCVAGKPRWLARHFARLRQGCDKLQLAPPDEALLREEVAALCQGQSRCLIKLIYTRGVAAQRGYRPQAPAAQRPTRIAARYPWSEDGGGALRLGWSTVTLADNPRLAGIKHLNRLEQVLAQADMADTDFDEMLMCSATGPVICGTMSNVFVPDGAVLRTPDLSGCGVAGVMRSLVLQYAPAAGFTVSIEPLTPERLAVAASLWLSNVRLGLRPVSSLDGRKLEADPRLARLQELVDATPA
ncbi:MAG TPA: aminodeoxychorismate lyase [Steroidobacteraceae bacterium]